MTLLAAEGRPPRPPRPASVNVAFWLQLAVVLLLFVMVGLVVAYAVYFDGQISRAVELVPEADPDEVSAERVGNIATSVVMGVMILAVAVWLAATAMPVLRGSNVARILVFVAAGAHVFLCAAPCLSGAAIAPIFLAGAPDEPSEGLYVGEEPWEESRFIETLYSQTLPFEDGFFLGMTVGSGIEVMLAIAVVVLLAVPPASRYFVPRTLSPAWPGGYALPSGAAMPAGAFPPAATARPMGPLWPGAAPCSAPRAFLRDLPGPVRTRDASAGRHLRHQPGAAARPRGRALNVRSPRRPSVTGLRAPTSLCGEPPGLRPHDCSRRPAPR